MKKSNGNDLRITIKNKGSKSFTIDVWELTSACWDCVHELEQGNPNAIMSNFELLDHLMQNYYTRKLIHSEQGINPCEEMEDIKEFINKHLRIIFASELLNDFNQALPKMQFTEV